MDTGLDNDRRSFIEHISLLLSQYHELVIHSLDDKEHYYMEEKMYTDKINHLHRQKEKLEEKIMEHYRKLYHKEEKHRSEFHETRLQSGLGTVQPEHLEDNVEADLHEEAMQPHESNSSDDDSHIIEAGLDPESPPMIRFSSLIPAPGRRSTTWTTHRPRSRALTARIKEPRNKDKHR
ncbi:daple-like protein [Nasonia vitripennis]|uniref:Uncharacterized protein n=1 Tax=Nasonia vitripennis TaxID=7425 RepID=A0A7M7T955_NASVI|nr:daple-like protein [Nasonia vitripennis]